MTELRYTRKGFGLRSEVHKDVEREFDSRVVRDLIAGGHRLVVDDLEFRLAKDFGFCYGVDRAIDYAYETRTVYPDRRVFLMGEIIHNPVVNERLSEMDIPIVANPVEEIPDLGERDVVIIPAFGVPKEAQERVRRAGPILVDTTCGSVLVVWKNVKKYAARGLTSLIHGKWYHEETRATASQAGPDGVWLVVLDLEEAEIVCDYIRGKGDRAAFLERFGQAASPGFDPDRDLERIGMANQTTMLASESVEIAARVKQAMKDRWGEEGLEERFVAFDTICSATQERQDALLRLLEEPMDLAIIVGGYNSSNTGHLAKIAAGRVPTYHIQHAGEIVSAAEIRHRDPLKWEVLVSRDWLHAGPLTIGLTAGASTPNLEIGRVIRRVIDCHPEA